MKIDTYPNPWDLKYFREIAWTENLSRAAERLGVGQPTLSVSLKRLEDQLGVELFERAHRGLSLTPAGQRLLNECNRLMAHWDAVVAETRRSETELRGRFTLGCHPSVGIYALAPLVQDIYRSLPGIELQLFHGPSRIVCERVISSNVDFGIVVNPVRHPDLVIAKLAIDEVGFWQAPGALKDVLLYNPEMAQSQVLLKKSKAHGFQRLLTSDNLEVLSSLARAGAGTVILPGRVAKAMAPELRKRTDLPVFEDEICFVHRSDLRKSASAKAIIEKLKNLKV